jgi:serine protease Do
MKASGKSFLLGLSFSIIFVVSFFGGGLADRVFGLRPLDYILRNKNNLLPTTNNSSPSVGATLLRPDEKTVVDIAARASESVVTVSIKSQPRAINPAQDPFFNFGFGFEPNFPDQNPQSTQPKQQDIGTGFVIDKSGLVVTNKHVVSESAAEYSVVDKSGKDHKVSKVYRDPVNDLAILKVEDLNVPVVELGDSDSLKVGQFSLAIGTALGELRHTVTTGVVSGLGRGIQAGDPFGASVESLENVIQTDAAINPGNSGGPLIDSSGKVIGVNVAVAAGGQNIGFAIPINVIKSSLDNFNKTGQFDRPLLGIRYRTISEQTALFNDVPQGAYIMEVVPNSSAAGAGLEEGDIITNFDGKSLKDNELAKLINQKKIGDQVKVEYWRKKEKKEATVTLKGES